MILKKKKSKKNLSRKFKDFYNNLATNKFSTKLELALSRKTRVLNPAAIKV